MTTHRLLAAAAIALLAGPAALAGQARPAGGPQPAVSPPNPALPAVQALFDGYVRDGKMPGIVAAFGVGDRPTQFVAAGRIADTPGAQAAGPDSLWRVYSMTKPVTGMAAMMLVEDGKLGLDDPVSKYIPAFAHMRVLTDPDHSLASVPAERPVTVRMLLTHTAGLGYSIVTKGPLLKEYERLGITPGAINAIFEAQQRRARPTLLADFANRVATLPLVYQPGTKWSYSIGLDVMGAVIEKASGMPFDRFVQARLFDPLKMTSSYWTVPAAETGRLATNYAFGPAGRTPFDPAATSVFLKPPSFPYGGAGLVMSARDYDRFLHMLQDQGVLDGVRVLKAETVRLAMSNLMPAGVFFGGAAAVTGGTPSGPPMGFGAGGSVYLEDGPGGMPGKGTYGWGGAAGTIAFVDPGRRIRGTIMVNYFPAEQWPLRTEAVGALVSDLAAARRR